MFGSLVIVYPAPHQGGEFVLRHKDREWTVDANTLNYSQPSPSVTYIAFYRDIEHEVLKVSSGCRVTLTYNLYLVDPTPSAQVPSVVPNLRDISNLQSTLHELLSSPEFLPDGGTLGFALAHLYPITFRTKLQGMVKYLKGEDAHVYRACRDLQLHPSLCMVYDGGEVIYDFKNSRIYTKPRGIMLKEIVEQPDYNYMNDSYRETLIKKYGGTPINLDNNTLARKSMWVKNYTVKRWEQITWLTFVGKRNRLKDVAMAYGNEVNVDHVCCSPCLIIPIAPASDRV